MKTNVLGIISLTMGILALLLSCTGFGVILGVPAAVLGLIGTCIPGYKKGLAIAGMICGICGVTLYIAFYIGAWAFNEAMKETFQY